MEHSNKDIQRIRTMSFFVEAVQKIIEEEGIDAVTIRKVSKLAGYNPATLYNYFDNIDYLVGFASIKYLKDYHQSLKDEVEILKDPEERFLGIWRKFCFYSFEKPKIYQALFFKTPRYSLCDFFDFYFKMFPEELGEHTFDIQRMMQGCHITSRNLYVLLPVLEQRNKEIDTAKIHQINELMITVFRGKLSECIEDQWSEAQRAKEVDKTVGYMKALLDL
ncbi:MAG: TetR/AcrR family transcriptional regulator [Clostridiaceae bacterium]